jgi:hypothetical protein
MYYIDPLYSYQVKSFKKGKIMSSANGRANALADRLEQGANALAKLAEGLNESQWKTVVPGDGRTVGVIISHVASVYPVEIELAQVIASGNPITGVTYDVISQMNAEHAQKSEQIGISETVELLRQNSKAAADSVRKLSDNELDTATLVSLNGDAPLTAQFFIEDHALRHSFHHMAKIKSALEG